MSEHSCAGHIHLTQVVTAHHATNPNLKNPAFASELFGIPVVAVSESFFFASPELAETAALVSPAVTSADEAAAIDIRVDLN